ncbi:uncharacterized protein PV09_05617 [Verruconis gallopava]|uniref:Uncharacterized protein n=1 Tax=Verruconis gallopava TaxID=253628 RepID=A0A0D2A871_9PEZI|nr:uncharacterized protein PV09_05617 [Verruconis gallopava]KIW02953.1 hypothetical protein PV09_05617 [Verruconis gallopava]
MASFWLYDSEENDLHAVRLLAVEQKPFQRVFKRLTHSDSVILKRSRHLPTPPPDVPEDGNVETEPADDFAARVNRERERWREDMKLDFAALESSMVRIQLLQRSNERERERYASKKLKIMDTAEKIRKSNIELKSQLELARQTMESRKKYDELADKIFSNKLLKSREEQTQMHEKLQKEIAEQEQEAKEYAQAVNVRRRQWFGAVQAALMDMKGIQHPELQQQDDELKIMEGDGYLVRDEEQENSGREGSRPHSRSRSMSAARETTPDPTEQNDEAATETEEMSKLLSQQGGATELQINRLNIEAMGEDTAMREEVIATLLENAEEGEATDSNDIMED